MSRAFEYVQKGEELCQMQRMRDAERAFRRALRTYEKEEDAGGVTYALGRLGHCYEQSGEVEKAIEAYRRAVESETDIPAIYSGLISLLVEQGKLDEAFRVADQWQTYGQRHISGPAHQVFTNIGARLTREKRYEEAIALLTRTVDAISAQRFPDEHWAAKSHLGYAHEKAGRIDAAMEFFSAAVKDGSTNRQTYTRYVMYLEKTKQYEQALRVIKQGLGVQRNAAWEADLRKRQQRIGRKAGKVPKEALPKIIPAFSVRRGKKSVSLVHQVKFSPQLTNLAVGHGMVYATSGGKNPKLSAWQIDSAVVVWQLELPEAASGVVATMDGIATHVQRGRVGEGATILCFLDLAGNEIASRRLPDVPSEVIAGNGRVYAGCRDGKLYAFSGRGKSLWSYRVPGSSDRQDSVYMRPSPYYVSAASNLVVFSSFSNVFALDERGGLRWRWCVPERRSTSRSGGTALTISLGLASVRGLAVAADGSRVVVTADDAIYELVNGRISGHVKRKGKTLGKVALDPTGAIWAIGADEQVLILQDRKAAGRFDAPPGARLDLDSEADRVVAWAGEELVVASLAGRAIADIEFVNRVSHAECVNNGRIVVGAGHLIILETSSQPSTTKSRSARRESAPRSAREDNLARSPVERPTEEQGIPIRWIEGQRLDTQRGKARFEGSGEQSLTIEQLALEHYSHLGYRGAWTENEYWWAIMALLFWDVLFARLPGVFTPEFGDFPSAMQDMPLDLFSADFYPRRKKLIQACIAELKQPKLFGLRKANIEADLKSAFRRHRGKPCRPIDWTRLTKTDDLVMATQVLTDRQLVQIMHRLLANFSENRSGLPDLFLAGDRKPLFCEVKSERERVADHQIDWMLYLRDEVGAPVEICRVIPKQWSAV